MSEMYFIAIDTTSMRQRVSTWRDLALGERRLRVRLGLATQRRLHYVFSIITVATLAARVKYENRDHEHKR